MPNKGTRDDGHTSEAKRGERQSAVQERYREIFEYNNDAVMLVDTEDEEFLDITNPPSREPDAPEPLERPVFAHSVKVKLSPKG